MQDIPLTLTHEQRLKSLREWINKSTAYQCDALEVVSGDASFRRYFRFTYQEQSIIAVDAPPIHEDAAKFARIAQAYLNSGVAVPKIYAMDESLGFYCLQDFGNKLFADELSAENCRDYYRQALTIIPCIQSCRSTALGPLPLYDDALLDREFGLFTDWLLGKHLGLSLSASEQSMLVQTFAYIRREFSAQPVVGVHRDYHSRNLMLLEDDSIGVIDFQDAVLGPLTYDAVSLLRDCYQSWPDSMVQDCLSEWHGQYFDHIDWQQFKTWFDITGMQRHIKASGIFARLCHRDGKVAYLQDIPQTLKYLIAVGAHHSQCRDFAKFVAERVEPAMQQSILQT